MTSTDLIYQTPSKSRSSQVCTILHRDVTNRHYNCHALKRDVPAARRCSTWGWGYYQLHVIVFEEIELAILSSPRQTFGQCALKMPRIGFVGWHSDRHANGKTTGA